MASCRAAFGAAIGAAYAIELPVVLTIAIVGSGCAGLYRYGTLWYD